MSKVMSACLLFMLLGATNIQAAKAPNIKVTNTPELAQIEARAKAPAWTKAKKTLITLGLVAITVAAAIVAGKYYDCGYCRNWVNEHNSTIENDLSIMKMTLNGDGPKEWDSTGENINGMNAILRRCHCEVAKPEGCFCDYTLSGDASKCIGSNFIKVYADPAYQS
jgi:hypothetical protein